MQKLQKLEAEHGPTVVIPEAAEGSSRAVGDDCSNPIIVSIPANLPFNDIGQTTCGRLDNYNLTCLGSYDGGEDIIYRLNVTTTTAVDITMDPLGTTWTGMALYLGCPDVGTCISYVTGSSGTRMLTNQTLTAGNSYYIIIDTWPSPTCIPSFNLNIVVYVIPPGSDCSIAMNYGNVNGPPVSGTLPSLQSRWYTFTSPANMITTASLCGSSFDTKIDIYPACGVSALWSNDDYCGLQSQINNIPVGSGQVWYARVYGYGSGSGNYTLTITGTPVTPPPNDLCTTAQPISGPYPQTVNGTTVNAFMDCLGVLNWNAVWYSINLPYPVNNVFIDFCGTTGNIPTIGIVYYNNCSDCGAYSLMSYVFNACSNGYTNPKLTAMSVPGPGTIYFPAFVGATGMNFQFTANVTSFGDLDGHVTNYYGVAIGGATVAIEDLGLTTTSAPDGYYQFLTVPAGIHPVSCTMTGYNPLMADIDIIGGGLTTHNFVLTQPNMVVQPLIVEETLNPNEYFTFSMSVLNNGTGPLGWAAEVVYPPTSAASAQVNHPEPAPQGEIRTSANSPASILANNGSGQPSGNRALTSCPETSFFSYVVDIDNAVVCVTSETVQGTPYKVYQKVTNLSDQVGSITFWGVSLTFSGGWYVCSGEDPVNFLVEFWEDGSIPGDNIASYLVTATVTNVGNLWGSYPLYEYTVQFPNVDMPTGWISIQGQAPPSGPDCTFLWVSAQTYYSPTLQWNGSTYADPGYGVSQAICLSRGSGGAGGWLTMDYYEGNVEPFGGVNSVPTHMNASGTEAGQVYTANIVFTSDPNVATITVPVTMIIAGNPLNPPDDLVVELVNDLTGEVHVSWTWTADALQYFLVKRDGVVIGTTTAMNFTDILPDYGTYCYTVQAVYDEGQTVPAGPECVEWANPTIFIDPPNLEAWVWQNYQVTVYTTIHNIGIGTLHYTFPDFAGANNLPAHYTINLPAGPANARTADCCGFRSLQGSPGKHLYAASWKWRT